jgi:glycosyltransferase involved in cell wall biosynthesis
LKIAYVVTRAEPVGGVQIHIRDLAVSLQAQGHAPTVLTGGGGPFVDVLRATGIPVVNLPHLTAPISPIRDLLALREIYSAVKDLRPDLIAVHSSKAGILGRLAGRSLDIPALLTAHGWNFTPGIPPIPAMMYRQIERAAGPLASRIITVSEFDRQLALEARLASDDRIVTVHNGIPDIPPHRRAQPDRTPVRLMMVARFERQKDHPTLLRALAQLQNHSWELDLIGDGPLMGQMESLAASLGIHGRVRFLGQRMDVDQLLAGAQVSVLATNWEGFPLSILEAMRAGLPVLATSVAGIGEAVSDGETGYLVPRGDLELLRERVERLLTDPQLRLQLGRGGRSRYERHFTLDHFVARTLAVYQDVLSERTIADVRRRGRKGDASLGSGASSPISPSLGRGSPSPGPAVDRSSEQPPTASTTTPPSLGT